MSAPTEKQPTRDQAGKETGIVLSCYGPNSQVYQVNIPHSLAVGTAASVIHDQIVNIMQARIASGILRPGQSMTDLQVATLAAAILASPSHTLTDAQVKAILGS